MLAKCANPSCDAPFRYLRDGRLFQLERGDRPGLAAAGHNVEHYWLCGACARQFTLTRGPEGGVAVVPQARAA